MSKRRIVAIVAAGAAVITGGMCNPQKAKNLILYGR